MKYPFLTLDDGTGFHNASCFIPGYEWKSIHGFSEQEIEKLQEIIESTAHLILEFARNGGFENASVFLVNENKPLEPVHVYISKGHPEENATKIWITKSGKCLEYADAESVLSFSAPAYYLPHARRR